MRWWGKILKHLGVWSNILLTLLPGLLCPEVEVTVKFPSIGQIDIFKTNCVQKALEPMKKM